MAPRDARLQARPPLSVQVLTEPALRGCFSVNISHSGIGLVATPLPDEWVPQIDDPLDVELRLPTSDAVVRARGLVVWSDVAQAPEAAELSVSLGLRFVQMADASRVEVQRYVQDGRFRVVVAFASDADRQAARTRLEEVVDLYFADDLGSLQQLAERGDVSALLLCSGRRGQLEAALDWLGDADGGTLSGERIRDSKPRVLQYGDAPAELIVRYARRGTLSRVLPFPLEAEELGAAVLDACQDHGLRTDRRRLMLALERALRRERTRASGLSRAQRVHTTQLVHASEAMGRVLDHVRAAAPYDIGVLLQGETGTGKELLAREVHEYSDRAHEVFVVQDCGALTETLLESELFGHVRGSFTGATRDHAGLFVLADGGTVFLDEIENTSSKLQAKLLRVIEMGEVRPVGGTRARLVDVRVIGASNRPLLDEVEAGRMRRDLYYRLASFPIEVPPLRDRRADIVPLAQHLLALACQEMGRDPVRLTRAAEQVLEAHDWPGNGREVRNVVERALVLTPPGAEAIDVGALPQELVRSHRPRGAGDRSRRGMLSAQLKGVEVDLIREALERHAGVIRRAAVELGLDASTLSRKAKRYGLT